MHDEVNFTKLNRIANHCARSIMGTDTFQQVKMNRAQGFSHFASRTDEPAGSLR